MFKPKKSENPEFGLLAPLTELVNSLIVTLLLPDATKDKFPSELTDAVKFVNLSLIPALSPFVKRVATLVIFAFDKSMNSLSTKLPEASTTPINTFPLALTKLVAEVIKLSPIKLVGGGKPVPLL